MVAPRYRSSQGATLLEVMVALGILATGYVALLRTQSATIHLSTYGKQVAVAAFLAQTKIEETEEKLIKDGFPDMDESEDGDFEELGYPSFQWKLEVNKVELPLAAAFERLLQSFGKEGEEGDGGGAGKGMLDKLGASGPKVAEMLQGGPTGGGGITAMLNPDMLKGNLDMLATMLEQALREVRLTVSWEGGGEDKEVALTTHLVKVPQLPSGMGGQMPVPIGGGQALPGTIPGTLAPGEQTGTGKQSPMR